MSDNNLELNLGQILRALLQTHNVLEIDPDALAEESQDNYQLVLSFNDETNMFEVSLAVEDES